MNFLHGYPVVITDAADDPKFKLAANVPVTPEYRKSFNAWAREFFGVEHNVFFLDGKYVMSQYSADKMRIQELLDSPNDRL